jgi:MtN3 and saliva related transmembrane protein
MEILKFIATVICPTLSSILITIAYLPQIIKTLKTKSVRDLSLGFWILISSFLVCMVTNATYLYLTTPNSLGYLITEAINLLLALVVLFQIIYYSKRTPAHEIQISLNNSHGNQIDTYELAKALEKATPEVKTFEVRTEAINAFSQRKDPNNHDSERLC